MDIDYIVAKDCISIEGFGNLAGGGRLPGGNEPWDNPDKSPPFMSGGLRMLVLVAGAVEYLLGHQLQRMDLERWVNAIRD